MLNKMRSMKNKKGFTLVELIVVLVILAILAAILIPSLSGYVDKANNRAAMAEAHSALLAAQTLASEQYAEGNDPTFSGDDANVTAGDIEDLAEVSGTVSDVQFETNSAKVTNLKYTPKKGAYVTYTWSATSGGSWS